MARTRSATKTYGAYCSLAHGLDIVGQRWALLVVRDLLDGPLRYSDLLASLPGVATDQLASRLRALVRAGVVERATLPPPAAARVYRLTARGRELEPILVGLARWSGPTLGAKKRDQAFRLSWLGLWFRAAFRPERATGPARVLQLEHGREVCHVTVAEQALAFARGSAAAPDVTLAGDLTSLAMTPDAATGLRAAVARGTCRLTGEGPAIAYLLGVFGLDGRP